MIPILMATGVMERMADSSWYLAVAGFCGLVLLFSLLTGHDHDHEVDHDTDHDHDHSHEGGHASHANMSIFSLKVIMACGVGFGVGGYVGVQNHTGPLGSLLCGLLGGLLMGGLAYLFLNALYRSQNSSTVQTSALVGTVGSVETTIPANGIGRVTCRLPTGRNSFLARSANGTLIHLNTPVKVTSVSGTTLIVEAN